MIPSEAWSICATSDKSKMWSNMTYSLILAAISGFGTLSNLTCFDYIRKTFDTRGNVFYILVMDCLTTAIGSGLYCITNVINLINEDVFKTKTSCFIHFLGHFLPTTLGPTFMLMISLRRFLALSYPTISPHNSRIVNLIASTTIAFACVYYFTILLLNVLMDLKTFAFIEICLGKDHSKETSNVSYMI